MGLSSALPMAGDTATLGSGLTLAGRSPSVPGMPGLLVGLRDGEVTCSATTNDNRPRLPWFPQRGLSRLSTSPCPRAPCIFPGTDQLCLHLRDREACP